MLNGSSIIIQTGNNAFFTTNSVANNPFNYNGEVHTPLPCRVKVWKIGKIPT